MTYLPSTELARLATIDRTWRDSARLIYRNRILEAFGETGRFRYVFGMSVKVRSTYAFY